MMQYCFLIPLLHIKRLYRDAAQYRCKPPPDSVATEAIRRQQPRAGKRNFVECLMPVLPCGTTRNQNVLSRTIPRCPQMYRLSANRTVSVPLYGPLPANEGTASDPLGDPVPTAAMWRRVSSWDVVTLHVRDNATECRRPAS